MKNCCFVLFFFIGVDAFAQPVKEKLAKAFAQLETDPQLRHAIIGFEVTDGKTGQVVYEHNAQVGLAPASTQKLFTSCAAFDLLGKDFTYSTVIEYHCVKDHMAAGYVVIRSSGDPSFGSARFAATRPAKMLEDIAAGLRQQNNDGLAER